MGLHAFYDVQCFGKLHEVLSCDFGKRLQIRILLCEPGNEQMEGDPEAFDGTWSCVETTGCKITGDDSLHARFEHFASGRWTRHPRECSGLSPMIENDLELEEPAFVVLQLLTTALG